jgi:hypothetical protein
VWEYMRPTTDQQRALTCSRNSSTCACSAARLPMSCCVKNQTRVTSRVWLFVAYYLCMYMCYTQCTLPLHVRSRISVLQIWHAWVNLEPELHNWIQRKRSKLQHAHEHKIMMALLQCMLHTWLRNRCQAFLAPWQKVTYKWHIYK